MAELTLEQQRAIALAQARLRAKLKQDAAANVEAAPSDGSVPVEAALGTTEVAPDATADAPRGVTAIPVVGPIVQAGATVLDYLNSGGGVSKEQEKQGWKRGILLPYAKNPETGELQWAVPSLVQGTIEGAKQAVDLPREVLEGKYPMRPGQSVESWMAENPELTGETLNAASFMLPSVPKGAELLSTEGKAIRSSILEAQKAAKETGIPLTRGQMEGMALDMLRKSGIEPTADQIGELSKRLVAEESLRRGGDNAPKIMGRFAEAQKEAVNSFVDTVGKNFPDVQDLAVVPSALKDVVAASKDTATSLYKIAENGGVVMDAGAVKTLPDYLKARFSSPDIDVILDEGITPGAVAAMRTIDDFAARVGDTNISLTAVDVLGKRIRGIKPKDANDARALSSVKRFYNDWVDAVERASLYSGDEAAFEALKKARAEASKYLEITSPTKPTYANEIVAKMATDDVSPEQVSNWLFGANVAAPNLNAPAVARRLKKILGSDSDAWSAVRASLWNKLTVNQATGDIYQPTQLLSRLQTMLNAKGVSLSKAVFSEDEIKQMRTLEQALKTATQKPPSGLPIKEPVLSNAGAKALAFFATLFTTGNMGSAAMAASIPVFKDISREFAARAATSGKAILPKAVGETLPEKLTYYGATSSMRPETGLLRSEGQNVQDITNMLEYMQQNQMLPGQAPVVEPAVEYNPDGSVTYRS